MKMKQIKQKWFDDLRNQLLAPQRNQIKETCIIPKCFTICRMSFFDGKR